MYRACFMYVINKLYSFLLSNNILVHSLWFYSQNCHGLSSLLSCSVCMEWFDNHASLGRPLNWDRPCVDVRQSVNDWASHKVDQWSGEVRGYPLDARQWPIDMVTLRDCLCKIKFKRCWYDFWILPKSSRGHLSVEITLMQTTQTQYHL